MKRWIIKLRQNTLLRDTRGLASVEYVVILVLIAAIAIVTWKSLGENVAESLGGANSKFEENVGNADLDKNYTSDGEAPDS